MLACGWPPLHAAPSPAPLSTKGPSNPLRPLSCVIAITPRPTTPPPPKHLSSTLPHKPHSLLLARPGKQLHCRPCSQPQQGLCCKPLLMIMPSHATRHGDSDSAAGYFTAAAACGSQNSSPGCNQLAADPSFTQPPPNPCSTSQQCTLLACHSGKLMGRPLLPATPPNNPHQLPCLHHVLLQHNHVHDTS